MALEPFQCTVHSLWACFKEEKKCELFSTLIGCLRNKKQQQTIVAFVEAAGMISSTPATSSLTIMNYSSCVRFVAGLGSSR